MQILGVCGSLQRESANLSLLHRATEIGADLALIEMFDGIRDLPLFNPDFEGEGAPESVRSWRAALVRSDAVLIATPEYGHSLPGALKNAIDWVIGSGELYRKAVAVTSAAPGPGRGKRGLLALCTTLNGVGARILDGGPIVRGASFDEELRTLLEALVEFG